MKSLKEIKTVNGVGNIRIDILFEDGSEFSHAVTSQEFAEIQKGDRMYLENLIARYKYRDAHSVVSVYRYVNAKGDICCSPANHVCGQCKFFRQTGIYYSEVGIGCPDTDSWPYPVGTCQKHGFGPRLSAFRSGDHCGWEIADWCKLDDRTLTEEEEKHLRELWK